LLAFPALPASGNPGNQVHRHHDPRAPLPCCDHGCVAERVSPARLRQPAALRLARSKWYLQAMAEPAAARLSSFLAKFDPAVARLIRGCRTVMRKRFPTANEFVYDNYNFLVIGYGPTERPSDCVASLAANSKSVNLNFLRGSALADPHKILQGAGRQNRFVRLHRAATLSKPEVQGLLTAAAQACPPFPPSGRGKLIIRSVSKKQRPRR
jgi:hypothetical protein